MILPIRDLEAVYYECSEFIICQNCYEEKLIKQLRILYTMVISRTTIQALEIASTKTCHQCGKAIKFMFKRVIVSEPTEAITSISLNCSAAVIYTNLPPSTNYENPAILKATHDALILEARRQITKKLLRHVQGPVVFDFAYQAMHANNSAFFKQKIAHPLALVAVHPPQIQSNSVNVVQNELNNPQPSTSNSFRNPTMLVPPKPSFNPIDFNHLPINFQINNQSKPSP